MWSLREAQEVVTSPSAPTPPATGGGGLPATGIENSINNPLSIKQDRGVGFGQYVVSNQ